MKRVNGCIGQQLLLILWRNQSPSISNSAPKIFGFHGALLLLNTYGHEPKLLNRNSFENLVEACLWKCVPHKIRGTRRRWNSAWSSCSDHSYWELHYPQYGYTLLTDQTPEKLTEAVIKGSHLRRYCIAQWEQEKMLLDLMLQLKSVEICLLVSVKFKLWCSK